jgi:hypothetical protein
VKNTLMWIAIILLALRVFGDWKDQEYSRVARQRFYDKTETIFRHVYDIVEDDVATKTEAELKEEVIKTLKFLLVFEDPDFRALSKEERDNFIDNVWWIAKEVHAKNQSFPDATSPAVKVGKDVILELDRH